MTTTPRPPEGPWGGVIPPGWVEHEGEKRIPGLWYVRRHNYEDTWEMVGDLSSRPLIKKRYIYIKPAEEEEVEKSKTEYFLALENGDVLRTSDYTNVLNEAKRKACKGLRGTIFKSILEVSPGEPVVKEYEA